MLVINSHEFSDNPQKYMDLADSNQQVVIQRGKDKAYVLTSIGKNDRYFMDTNVMAEIQEAIHQYRTGKITEVAKADLDQLLGL